MSVKPSRPTRIPFRSFSCALSHPASEAVIAIRGVLLTGLQLILLVAANAPTRGAESLSAEQKTGGEVAYSLDIESGGLAQDPGTQPADADTNPA